MYITNKENVLQIMFLKWYDWHTAGLQEIRTNRKYFIQMTHLQIPNEKRADAKEIIYLRPYVY